MGYTHYWYREKEIEAPTYQAIVDDFRKLLPIFARSDVPLADGMGEGYPQLDAEMVYFNGSENCGHPKNKELVIPWPAKTAQGIGNKVDAINGKWFAGAVVDARTCDGDCSYETFAFPRIEDGEANEDGKYFNCTKTAFRPYDWAVTAFLVIAKHYLGEKITVHSDGEMAQWQDAMLLCQLELDYGMEFRIDS